MLRQPDLCAPASLFTHFGLYGDHSRAYKAHSTSAAVTTNTFDGQASVNNSVANSSTTTVYGIVDYWANSSLGIAFQQAYGAGVSHMFYSSYLVTQLAELTASDGVETDLFGLSVAMSGDTIVVGAPCMLSPSCNLGYRLAKRGVYQPD